MSDLHVGERTTVTLQIGSVLILSASPGASGSIVRLAASAGGEPFAPVSYSGAPITLGPFDEVTRFALQADAGIVTYLINNVIISAVNAYAGRYRKTLTSGRTTTIVVPAGSKLTIASSLGSSGYTVLLPGFSPITPYNGTYLEIGPFSDTRVYQAYCGYGWMMFETAWAAAPLNAFAIFGLGLLSVAGLGVLGIGA